MRDWTEEELLEQLDELTSEDPLKEAGPILDELDRRGEDIPAFDTDAGWQDLMTRTRKGRRPHIWKKYPLAAAIALVCLLTTAAAVGFGLHENIAAYFGIGEGQEALVEQAVDTPALSVTDQGVTVNVLQTMADRYSVYVLYEIIFPEHITIPENFDALLGWLWVEQAPVTETAVQMAVGGNDFLEQGPHYLQVLAYYVPSNPVAAGEVSLSLDRISYYWDGQDVILVEGDWELTWELTAIEPGITLTPESPVGLAGWACQVSEITISPFSLHIYTNNGPLPELPMALVLRNGSRVELDPADYEHVTGGGFLADAAEKVYRGHFYYRFYDVIDPEQVIAVIIGETEIPFP